jgi:hypothetical protein
MVTWYGAFPDPEPEPEPEPEPQDEPIGSDEPAAADKFGSWANTSRLLCTNRTTRIYFL